MKKRSTLEKITDARNILELPESSTMKEIKTNYKKLMLKWHPDKCTDKKKLCEEMTKKINDAYKIISDYCDHYEFSFSEVEVEKYITVKEWWFKRFGKDPIWSNYNDKD